MSLHRLLVWWFRDYRLALGELPLGSLRQPTTHSQSRAKHVGMGDILRSAILFLRLRQGARR